MIRTRLLIAALVLGTGLFVASSSAEAHPNYYRVYRAPVYRPPVCYPAPVVNAPCVPVYRPAYHYRSYYHGRRWHR